MAPEDRGDRVLPEPIRSWATGHIAYLPRPLAEPGRLLGPADRDAVWRTVRLSRTDWIDGHGVTHLNGSSVAQSPSRTASRSNG